MEQPIKWDYKLDSLQSDQGTKPGKRFSDRPRSITVTVILRLNDWVKN